MGTGAIRPATAEMPLDVAQKLDALPEQAPLHVIFNRASCSPFCRRARAASGGWLRSSTLATSSTTRMCCPTNIAEPGTRCSRTVASAESAASTASPSTISAQVLALESCASVDICEAW